MNISAEPEDPAVQEPKEPTENSTEENSLEAEAAQEPAAQPESVEVDAVADPPEEVPEPEVPDMPATRLTRAAFAEELRDEDALEPPPPRKPKKQRRKTSRTPRKNQPTLPKVTDRFAACGRCSYFWAGYRVLFGMEELETAVSQSKSGWLELIWNDQMPDLVLKSFGVRLDITHLHYEGCCNECRRHFIYQAADKEDEADAFRIEITPRMAK